MIKKSMNVGIIGTGWCGGIRPKGARGFAYCATKDQAMVDDAAYGFMLSSTARRCPRLESACPG